LVTVSSERGLETFRFSVGLPLRDEWESAERARVSIEQSFAFILRDLDGSTRLSTIASELAENAIKYGDWNLPGATGSVTVWGGGGEAHVSVESPVRAESPRLRTLLQLLDAYAAHPDPGDLYREKILEAAALPAGESGLGLPRLMYECGAALHAEVRGATLRVTADVRLDSPAQPV
jgi:hypothetical protein